MNNETKTDLWLYFKKWLKWGSNPQSRIIFNWLISVADFCAGGVILDAGCGAQRYKPFFERSKYIGQEHPIAGAKNKGLKKYDILCDVKRIPLDDCSIDAVLSTSSLEHFEHPDEFAKEAYRILKTGGRLFINAPFAYEEHEIPYDFQRYTRYGMKRLYEKAGFINVTVEPTSSSIYTGVGLFSYAAREKLRSIRERYSVLKMPTLAISACVMVFAWIIKKAFDRGPSDETRLPCGWISSGEKR
jgi:SAM-dependent methyltransferase